MCECGCVCAETHRASSVNSALGSSPAYPASWYRILKWMQNTISELFFSIYAGFYTTSGSPGTREAIQWFQFRSTALVAQAGWLRTNHLTHQEPVLLISPGSAVIYASLKIPPPLLDFLIFKMGRGQFKKSLVAHVPFAIRCQILGACTAHWTVLTNLG